MNLDQYLHLKKKYGKCSGWALWNDDNQRETKIIDDSVEELHSNYVFVGLNISMPLQNDWDNFRIGKHDRKLIKAFNHGEFRGAFMTDLFEGIVIPKSNEFLAHVKRPDFDMNHHIDYFRQKMKDVGVTEETVFILMGGDVKRFFPNFINGNFKAIPIRHYSDYRTSDADWVKEALDKIKSASR